MNWQNKVSGVLALWLVVLGFLNFSDTLQKILLVATAAAIALLSFFGKALFKSDSELADLAREIEPEKND